MHVPLLTPPPQSSMPKTTSPMRCSRSAPRARSSRSSSRSSTTTQSLAPPFDVGSGAFLCCLVLHPLVVSGVDDVLHPLVVAGVHNAKGTQLPGLGVAPQGVHLPPAGTTTFTTAACRRRACSTAHPTPPLRAACFSTPTPSATTARWGSLMLDAWHPTHAACHALVTGVGFCDVF